MAVDQIAAAIDIGSNTVHMLAGRWRDGRVEPLDDASELVGLGQDVYAGGAISPQRLAHAAESVAALAQRARDHGATTILLIATAAVRDAANADDLAAAVRERAGLEMRTVDGQREAELTFRGAAAGEEVPSLQVCDVGGGSTEVIRAQEGQILLRTSLPIGSSRLSQQVTHDPPEPGEVGAAYAAAAAALAGLPRWRPARLVVTGGTASALACLAGGSGRRHELSPAGLEQVRALLAQQPAQRISAEHGVEPKRARLLPAGAAIITAIRDNVGMEAQAIVLSAAGLRDGLLSEHFAGRR